MTDVIDLKMDLESYLDKCGGTEVINFGIISDDPANAGDEAYRYAKTLRARYEIELGEYSPNVVADGARVLISMGDIG